MPITPLAPAQNLDLIAFYVAALRDASPTELAAVAPFLRMAEQVLAPSVRKLDVLPPATPQAA